MISSPRKKIGNKNLTNSSSKRSTWSPLSMAIGLVLGFSLHYVLTFTPDYSMDFNAIATAQNPSVTGQGGLRLEQTTAQDESAAAAAAPNTPWKLWHVMTDSEQQDALARLQPYVEKYSTLMQGRGQKYKKHGKCESVMIGSGGEHALCGPAPTQPCSFISFGINDDPSFDVDLATRWGCRGFASDPTVHHPSKLHPNVTFHNIGATLLVPNEERLINKGGTSDWWETSMPSLRKFLKLDYIDILKLDCEGCEISLARDILAEDPTFLHHVGQISIETHVTRTWINSTEHVYYFGLMFPLLEEAGFQMETSSIFGCSKRHEITGCHPDLVKTTFPCGYDPWPGKTKVVLGRSCHDFLFKRYPKEK